MPSHPFSRAAPAVLLLGLAAACTGEVIGGAGVSAPEVIGGAGGAGWPAPLGGTPGGGPPDMPPLPPVAGGPMVEPLAGPPLRSAGPRRLSRDELARSIARLLGSDVPVDTSLLPEATLTPFDNDVLEQSPSLRLVEAAESIARGVAGFVTGTPERLQRLLPCTPTGATDAGCFGQFLARFGRRVLRRPLSDAELAELAGLLEHARTSGRFADGVGAALEVFLMHPEFLYRVEPGASSSAGTVRLTGHEVASRLAFLLEGATPDDALLEAAAAGRLDSAAGVLTEARRLLASPYGQTQLRRFHAFWLGYAPLGATALERKLRQETDALVDRASAADRDHRLLLLADETHIDAELAAHYGLAPAGSGFAWQSYGAAPRRGILAHGLFAAAGAKFTDTSPTRRGKFIRERLLCQVVPLPSDADVDVDLPPMGKTADACKRERYRQHREDPECAGCHAVMDPLGFGLENFDELGRFRTHEAGRPDCAIDGTGALDERTPFTGARELATLLAEAPELLPCLGQHVIRFAAGRALDPLDARRARWLGDEMKKGGNAIVAMLLAYVGHDNFRHREP